MTVAQYHAYVQYDGPTVRRYYPLVFDAPGYRMPSEWRAFNPGGEHLDGYALDFYCPDLIRKGHGAGARRAAARRPAASERRAVAPGS